METDELMRKALAMAQAQQSNYKTMTSSQQCQKQSSDTQSSKSTVRASSSQKLVRSKS